MLNGSPNFENNSDMNTFTTLLNKIFERSVILDGIGVLVLIVIESLLF